ncbi:glutamine amidotransferase-related protein [Buchnera aphidicola]|uniref:glutamine amidotransferase-related protein n=1 Tax=Buchnera aphidicola TaxID=9 RepID=UPI0031B67DB0
MYNILLLNNLDSLTYNLINMLKNLKQKIIIYRNTENFQTILLTLTTMKNPIIILSSGPGIPENSGCLLKILTFCKGKIPILGIGLGYLAIIKKYNGIICHSKIIKLGQFISITHDQSEMFLNIPNPLLVARYYTLVCKNIPKDLIVNACFKNTPMSIRNNFDRICGLNFHPESILTFHGKILLKQHIEWLRS